MNCENNKRGGAEQRDECAKRIRKEASGTEIREMKMRLNNAFCVDASLSGISDMKRYMSKVILSGETSTGKSSISNAILGHNILPTGEEIVTKLPQMQYLVQDSGRAGTYEMELVKNVRKEGRLGDIASLDTVDGVYGHLQRIYGNYPKENYSDQVNIRKFVPDVSYFHILDLPGMGTVENGPEEIMTDSPTNINVIVIRYKSLDTKFQAGIYETVISRFKGERPMIGRYLIVLNRIDTCVPSERCNTHAFNQPESGCDGCKQWISWRKFTSQIHAVYADCQSVNIPLFFVQSMDPKLRRYDSAAEEKTVREIKSLWNEDSNGKEILRGVRFGINGLKDFILSLSVDSLNAGHYEEILVNLRKETAIQEQLYNQNHLVNSGFDGLFSQLSNDREIVDNLCDQFIRDNVERTRYLSWTDRMRYNYPDLKESSVSPLGCRLEEIESKHLKTCDDLVDNVCFALSKYSDQMSGNLVDTFQSILSERVYKVCGEKNEDYDAVMAHWNDRKNTIRFELSKKISEIFSICKNVKYQRFCIKKVQKMERRKALQMKAMIEGTISSQDSNVSEFNGGYLYGAFNFVTRGLFRKSTSNEEVTQVPEAKSNAIVERISVHSIVPLENMKNIIVQTEDPFERCKEMEDVTEMEKKARYVSANSRFYRMKIYKKTRKPLEKCLEMATTWIFSYLTEVLMVEYPKQLYVLGFSLLNDRQNEREITRNVIQDRIKRISEVTREVIELIQKMTQ